jgi:hypothetical protein
MKNNSTFSMPSAGLHVGVPLAEYLAWPVMSQSVLKMGRKSMAHLRAAMDQEREIVPTDDMLLGSALHTVFLEPETIIDRVVRWDGGARRGKEWEAFKLANAGKIILTENGYASMVGMVRALRAAPEVKRWLGRIEAVEVSCVGTIDGVPMKARVDALTSEPIIDLKKVSDGDPRVFMSTAYKYGYHIQAYVYSRLFGRKRFVMLTVEDEPPYDVVPYELDEDFMEIGRQETTDLLASVRQCMESGAWPGRSSEIVPMNAPAWLDQTKPSVRIS